MRRSKPVGLFDFDGGLQTKTVAINRDLNAASDAQNIVLLPGGGFASRNGNAAHNSSAIVSGSTAVTGLGYFRTSAAADFLVATGGTKFFADSSLSGTFSDVTGAITISSAATNIWTFSTMNDLIIGVGGAPDAPFKYSGTGNAAALAGSPPSGNFGLEANNYFFIGNTSANPSRIQWSALGNPEDWSGTGSGNQDISKNDGDVLIGASLLNVSNMLLFKQNSIHILNIQTPPFPVFLKFKGVGAVSKKGIVNVDGVTYFITPQPRMKATDGVSVLDFPDTIDDVWDGLNNSRLAYIHGQYNRRLRQIWWYVSNGTSSTHNLCIVWDLVRKCWLRYTTGFSMNSSVNAQDHLTYAGAYNGIVYQQDKSNTYADASEASPGQINAYWTTPWLDFGVDSQTKLFPYFTVSYLNQSTGTFDVSYGFNFVPNKSTATISMIAPGSMWDAATWDSDVWGGQTNQVKYVFVKGTGNVVQFQIKHNSSTEGFTFNGLELPLKLAAVSKVA